MASSARRKQTADHKLKKAEHARMELTGADRDAFLALLNPPEPTEKLIAALRRHRAELG